MILVKCGPNLLGFDLNDNAAIMISAAIVKAEIYFFIFILFAPMSLQAQTLDAYLKSKKAIEAGANFVVIGNSLEKNINLLFEIEKAFY